MPLSVMVGAMYRYGTGFSFTVTVDLAQGLEPDAGDVPAAHTSTTGQSRR